MAAYEAGARFYKLSGSGNDFVAFDLRGQGSTAPLPDALTVRRLCRRGEGVGADGVLVLADAPGFDYRLVYYNADGSRADLCGNASLCGVRLAVELGRSSPTWRDTGGEGAGERGSGAEVYFLTDAGAMRGRMRGPIRPEIDLAAPAEVAMDSSALWDSIGGAAPGEERMGFALVGVPHLVVLCESASSAALLERGPILRSHPALSHGANVNFVSRAPGGDRTDAGEWEIRTFERGVEAETLACGTGAVATAVLLRAWGLGAGGGPGEVGRQSAAHPTADSIRLRTRSGRVLEVSLREEGGEPHPSLSGDARIVYQGELTEG